MNGIKALRPLPYPPPLPQRTGLKYRPPSIPTSPSPLCFPEENYTRRQVINSRQYQNVRPRRRDHFLAVFKSSSNMGVGVACYAFSIDKFNGSLTTYWPKMSPCGNITTTATVLPCCGWGDKCLGNALCHVSDRIPPGTSGYYRAGCTDPNFPAPDCRQQCSKQTTS